MNRYPEPPPPLTPQNLSPQFLFFRDGRRDLRHTANPLGFMLLLIAISFTFLPQAFSSLLSFIGYRGSLAYRNFGNIEPTVYYLIQGCQFALSILVPCLLYLAIYRPAPAKIIPSQRVNPLVFLSLTFIGLGLSLFSNLPSQAFVERFSDLFSWDIASDQMAASAMPPLAIGLFLIRHAVFPAFFEEFIFRGIVLGQLRRFGEGFAIFTSALLFGMFHGNLPQIPFAFLVGLVLGYLLVKTNNIWLTAAVHFLNNLIAVLPEFLGPFLSADQMNLINAILFPLVFVLAVGGLIYLFLRHRHIFRFRFPIHPLPLGIRLGAFFSSIGIILLLLMNIGETIWRAI